jgi:hypothetical protein
MEVNTTDVLHSFQDIILLHKSVYYHWVHPRTQYEGPQLDRIYEKGIATFPWLTTLDIFLVVDFYDKLHKTTLAYLLPIMPFDCVSIRMGFKALCPPGLRVPKYVMIACILLEVLPELLPKNDLQITTIITLARMESNNGYVLLWKVMALVVPGFNPAIPVRILTWQDKDIFKFASAFTLFYRHHAKKGVYHDDHTRSITFLQAVMEPAYVDGVASLLTCVANYYVSMDNRYLPSHLCIMGLATQPHKNAATRAMTALPKVRCTIGHDRVDYSPDCVPSPVLSPTVLWAGNGHGHDCRFDDGCGHHHSPETSQARHPHTQVQGSRGSGRHSHNAPPHGRYIRPDRNRGAYLPDVTCDTCRQPGHVTANCNILAIALFIEKYKKDMGADSKDKLEYEWVKRWR